MTVAQRWDAQSDEFKKTIWYALDELQDMGAFGLESFVKPLRDLFNVRCPQPRGDFARSEALLFGQGVEWMGRIWVFAAVAEAYLTGNEGYGTTAVQQFNARDQTAQRAIDCLRNVQQTFRGETLQFRHGF